MVICSEFGMAVLLNNEAKVGIYLHAMSKSTTFLRQNRGYQGKDSAVSFLASSKKEIRDSIIFVQ